MAHIVGNAVFRTLKACRSIERAHAGILDDLSDMRRSACRTRQTLERATANLERTLEQFATAQERLRVVSDQHAEVMREIDGIRASSPAFSDLR